ncbi:hypothetical protein GCM10009789_17080 [Kribbella sancticallisti]|uniref:Uncharacterized protein n=1 Tax=Kribbella sancticallisti TaxID=460087 RepID=A0ABN2CVD9_9ACTN
MAVGGVGAQVLGGVGVLALRAAEGGPAVERVAEGGARVERVGAVDGWAGGRRGRRAAGVGGRRPAAGAGGGEPKRNGSPVGAASRGVVRWGLGGGVAHGYFSGGF